MPQRNLRGFFRCCCFPCVRGHLRMLVAIFGCSWLFPCNFGYLRVFVAISGVVSVTIPGDCDYSGRAERTFARPIPQKSLRGVFY